MILLYRSFSDPIPVRCALFRQVRLEHAPRVLLQRRAAGPAPRRSPRRIRLPSVRRIEGSSLMARSRRSTRAVISAACREIGVRQRPRGAPAILAASARASSACDGEHGLQRGSYRQEVLCMGALHGHPRGQPFQVQDTSRVTRAAGRGGPGPGRGNPRPKAAARLPRRPGAA